MDVKRSEGNKLAFTLTVPFEHNDVKGTIVCQKRAELLDILLGVGVEINGQTYYGESVPLAPSDLKFRHEAVRQFSEAVKDAIGQALEKALVDNGGIERAMTELVGYCTTSAGKA